MAKQRVEIHNARLYTGESTIQNGFVSVLEGAIEKVCPMEQAAPAPGAEVVDARGGIVLPGLINAHTHSPMALLKGVGSDLNLSDWLGKVMASEDSFDAEIARAGAMLQIMEMIRYGVTAFADMYMFVDEIAHAVAETGLRAQLGRGITHDEGERLAESRRLYRDWHGACGGRIQIRYAPHAEYTTAPKGIVDICRAAREDGAGIHVHVSETRAEVEGCISRHGKTPVAYFADLGLFDLPTLAAHCVAVTDEDIAILAEKGVYVAHNPVSNLKLASGVAPIPKMRRAGVKVCLGTDSTCSNNNIDMFEEMKIASILQKGVGEDPLLMPAADVISMATRQGALALGFDRVGLLKPGMRADIVALDHSAPSLVPGLDPASDIVYAARGADVRMTMVDGRILYLDGQYHTLDAQKVLRDARRAIGRIRFV